MLRGMAEAVAELGYANVSVADVLSRARVSRETFYKYFANKQDCFLASYRTVSEFVIDEIEAALAAAEGQQAGNPRERIETILSKYLSVLESEPAVARTFLVEAYAAGPAAIRRRGEIQNRFANALAVLFGARDERSRFACHAVVLTVGALVTQQVGSADSFSFEDLRPRLLELALSMFEASGLPIEPASGPR